MNRPTLLALAVAASLGAAAVVAVTSTEALADKVVTVLSAPAEVTSMEFRPLAGGTVHARVCGRSQYSGGVLTPGTCFDVVLPAANAIAVSVNALAAGNALTFWKTQEGL